MKIGVEWFGDRTVGELVQQSNRIEMVCGKCGALGVGGGQL